MTLPIHLGGHKNRTHTDAGALKYFQNHRSCSSLLDIGCGPGGQLQLAQVMGYNPVMGLDGDYTIAHAVPVQYIDFTTTQYQSNIRYDLGWCVEFLEHVDQSFMLNYMTALQSCDWLLVTHALPGEPGHHHVNCQTPEYWIDAFKNNNFQYCEEETQQVRAASTMTRNFVRERGLVFRLDQ